MRNSGEEPPGPSTGTEIRAGLWSGCGAAADESALAWAAGAGAARADAL